MVAVVVVHRRVSTCNIFKNSEWNIIHFFSASIKTTTNFDGGFSLISRVKSVCGVYS